MIKRETQSKWSPISHRHWYLVLNTALFSFESDCLGAGAAGGQAAFCLQGNLQAWLGWLTLACLESIHFSSHRKHDTFSSLPRSLHSGIALALRHLVSEEGLRSPAEQMSVVEISILCRSSS